MEILRFLLSFFEEEYKDTDMGKVIAAFKSGGDLSDIGSFLSSEKFLSIIKDFFKSLGNEKKGDGSPPLGLSPIKSIADEKIIALLNGCFS